MFFSVLGYPSPLSPIKTNFIPSQNIEELRAKREELNETIVQEEDEVNKIKNEIRLAQERLSRLTESLNKKLAARNEYDSAIAYTEQAYMKILESSQTLLHVLRRQSVSLQKKQPQSE